jgi:hypothetical protein
MSKTTGLIAYGLFFTGISLILISIFGTEDWRWPVWLAAFVRDAGLLLSAVVAGTILYERLLREEMVRQFVAELDKELTHRVPKLETISTHTAGKVHELLCERPPSMTGLRLITEVRRNFRGYYDWVNENGSQDLFFAGRSVLHRIDADIHARTESSAEAIILRRLREGSKIRIDFLDPRSDIIDRLAQEEGETPAALLGNIATSLGICRRLGELVRAHYLSLPAGAVLSVRVYDRMPYFAYHKQDNDVLVGFYFQSLLGSSSAAYELVDDTTRRTFSEHFVRIHADAASSTMVEFDGAAGRPLFNNELFNELRKQLSAKLGPSRVDELLAGRFADEQPGLSQPPATLT